MRILSGSTAHYTRKNWFHQEVYLAATRLFHLLGSQYKMHNTVTVSLKTYLTNNTTKQDLDGNGEIESPNRAHPRFLVLLVMAPAGAITGSTRKRGCALFHHSRAFVGFQLRSIAGWAWLPDDAEGSNLRHHLVVKLNGLPRNQVQTTYVAADCVVFPNRRIRTPKKFRSAVCPKKKLLAVDCFFL